MSTNSIPCTPAAFKQVWRVLGDRVVARGYLASQSDESTRRFVAAEVELGVRPAIFASSSYLEAHAAAGFPKGRKR